MESRSHAILAGLFVLALIVATAISVVWIGRKNVVYAPYELVTDLSVAGLSVQSQVRYQGMQVGQVQSLKFDDKEPGKIRILIGVLPETPITKGTWAEIATQGVTGISNIDLRDRGSDPVLVKTSAASPYVIPVRPGFLQRLQSTSAGMVGDVESLVRRLEGFITEENAKSFSEILQNTQKLTLTLNQTLVELEPTLKRLPQLADDMQQTLHTFNNMGGEISSLTKSAKTTIEMLNKPEGPIGLAVTSLKELQRSTAQLQNSVFPEINRVLASLDQASRSVAGVAREIERNPQSIIFGAAKVEPGPGEPGFAGFSH